MIVMLVCFMSLTSGVYAAETEIVSPEAVQNILSAIEQEVYDRREWLRRQPLFGRDGQPLEAPQSFEGSFAMVSRNLSGIAEAYGVNIRGAVPYIATTHEQPDRYEHRHNIEDHLAYIARKAAWLKGQLATRAVSREWYNNLQADYADIARLGRMLKRDMDRRAVGAVG